VTRAKFVESRLRSGDTAYWVRKFVIILREIARVDAAGIAPISRYPGSLVLRGPQPLHARGDQLVVEISDCWSIERYALGHRELLAETIISPLSEATTSTQLTICH